MVIPATTATWSTQGQRSSWTKVRGKSTEVYRRDNVLSLILPHMKRRTRLQGISGEMEAVIRALDTRLACLRVEIISWRKA